MPKVIAVQDVAEGAPLEAVLWPDKRPDRGLVLWWGGYASERLEESVTPEVIEAEWAGWKLQDIHLPNDWEEGYLRASNGDVRFVYGRPSSLTGDRKRGPEGPRSPGYSPAARAVFLTCVSGFLIFEAVSGASDYLTDTFAGPLLGIAWILGTVLGALLLRFGRSGRTSEGIRSAGGIAFALVAGTTLVVVNLIQGFGGLVYASVALTSSGFLFSMVPGNVQKVIRRIRRT